MNPSKVKGTRFESAVVAYLAAWFPHVERRALAGGADRGDLVGLPATVECKATRALDLAGALNEAQAAAARNRDPIYAAVVKRRQHGVSEAYAVMPLSVFAVLLAAWDGP
jgi:hypothetical protein